MSMGIAPSDRREAMSRANNQSAKLGTGTRRARTHFYLPEGGLARCHISLFTEKFGLDQPRSSLSSSSSSPLWSSTSTVRERLPSPLCFTPFWCRPKRTWHALVSPRC